MKKIGSIDTMFSFLEVSTWAKTIAGFILVLVILMSAVAIFGKSKNHLSGFGILIFALLGSILATAFGLFPAYVLLVFLILSLVAIIIKALFGGRT